MSYTSALLESYGLVEVELPGGQWPTREELAANAFAALRYVLAAHVVVGAGGNCRACTFYFPCATVRLITAALEAK